MKDWLRTARANWDAILALTLFYLAVAIYFGPGYYFLAWWIILTLHIVRVAFKRG